MGAALLGGIPKCWCHFRARNRGNIFLASIIEFFFSFFDRLKIKVVSLWVIWVIFASHIFML